MRVVRVQVSSPGSLDQAKFGRAASFQLPHPTVTFYRLLVQGRHVGKQIIIQRLVAQCISVTRPQAHIPISFTAIQ